LVHETEILNRYVAGDQEAFHYIYNKFQASVYYQLRSILDNREDVEDITADSFIKLWKLRPGFPNMNSLGAWLKTTSRNAAYDLLRHRKMAADKLERLREQAIKADESYTNDDLFAEALAEIYRQVEMLPPKSREVFRLRYLHGYSNQEIAELTGINNQSVRDHLSRALKILRAEILKKGNLFSFFLILLNTK
jgi:RNA polymerase sigma-70 factor (family 1)